MYPDPLVVRLGGRVLTVEDAGPDDGFPLLVHSGAPGSRHLAPAAVRAACRHGFRLISYDRPGYGGSTPMPGRTLADSGADVEAILRELGVGTIAAWGFSAGGPYALATAAALGEVVAAVCVFAPMGPYRTPGLDFLRGRDDSFRAEVRMFFEDPAAARAKFRSDAMESFGRLSTPEGWLNKWGDRAGKDPAHGRESAEYLASSFREGWTMGDEGWWEDWGATLSPWGFDPADIAAPVGLWHGLGDTGCPPEHSRWIMAQLRDVSAHFPARDDHTDIEDNNRVAALRWLSECVR